MENPYQDVIDWLRSPKGEKWSEERLYRGRRTAYAELGGPRRRTPAMPAGVVRYGTKDVMWWGGIMSVKQDYQEGAISFD